MHACVRKRERESQSRLLLFQCKRHLRGAKEAPRTTQLSGSEMGVEGGGLQRERSLAENGQKQIQAIITITQRTTTTSAAARTTTTTTEAASNRKA